MWRDHGRYYTAQSATLSAIRSVATQALLADVHGDKFYREHAIQRPARY